MFILKGSIIKRRAYKYEEHIVTTTDEWQLTMFRLIPKNNPNNIPVLIQHGLQMDATMWIVVQDRSLGITEYLCKLLSLIVNIQISIIYRISFIRFRIRRLVR